MRLEPNYNGLRAPLSDKTYRSRLAGEVCLSPSLQARIVKTQSNPAGLEKSL